MLEGKGWKRRHGSSSRGQLTPEKRPFLSSYVLMSVRRSKFEYILTLGWKYREGLLDSAWSRLDKIYRCCHRILGSVLNPESDSPGIFLWGPWNKNNMSWWEAAVNFSFMLISKEGKRGGIQSVEMNYHSTHSACRPILTAFNRNLCICRSFNTFSWKSGKFRFDLGRLFLHRGPVSFLSLPDHTSQSPTLSPSPTAHLLCFSTAQSQGLQKKGLKNWGFRFKLSTPLTNSNTEFLAKLTESQVGLMLILHLSYLT